MKPFTAVAVTLATLALVGCGVHQSAEAPPLTGPSTLATSVTITATPDTINYSINQNFPSPSTVKVSVFGPTGQPKVGQAVRLDMLVGGTVADYGTLQTRQPVSGPDGTVTVVYLAPNTPPPPDDSTVKTVTIRATAILTDAQASSAATADIRLVPVGVILPPAGTPTAAFTMSPAQALMNVPVTFDASGSTPGDGATQITLYSWNFGDGTAAGGGRSVTHTFTTQQVFNGTLTVTNDRGLSASIPVTTAVGALAAPTASFVFSPTAPAIGQNVVFNADQSAAAAGHTLTSFNWNFGDGATGSGFLVSHAFATAGTYNVVLSVTDDTGQKSTTSKSVTAGAAAASLPTADFTFSPGAPAVNQTVFFNAASSTAGSGHTLSSYAWNFGDGATGAGVTPSHVFAAAGTFTVTLTVTDEIGQYSVTSKSVAVSSSVANLPTANFTFSPLAPVPNQPVLFNASSSTPGTGHTLVSYAWNFGDGATGTGVTPSHPYSAAGTFTVTLTVTDEIGQVGVTSKTVTISGTQPVASFTFSPTTPAVNQPVFFNASSSTGGTGHTLVSYAWNFGDGVTGTGVTPSHPYSAAGTFTVTLIVTNEVGQTGTVSAGVTVAAGGGAPTANFTFSPSAPAPNQPVLFNASSSTAGTGHTLVSYAWNFGDGATGSGVTPSHPYSAAGTFTVTLTVTDEIGQVGLISKPVTITGTPPTASFTFLPATPAVNQTVFFDASSSTAGTGHRLVSYAWTFGDGQTGTGVTPTHAYSVVGTFAVTLTVTDEIGQVGVTSKTVIISSAPTASFTFLPLAPAVNQAVFFNASGSTAGTGHTLVSYAWNFGDGQIGTGVTPNHAYSAAGTFTVTLTVTDEVGQTGTARLAVNVATIVAEFVFSPTDPIAGVTTVFFDATPSSSPSTITSYVWDFGDGGTCNNGGLGCQVGGNGTAQKPQHVFLAPAHTWIVRLTITDSAGRTATVTHDVITR